MILRNPIVPVLAFAAILIGANQAQAQGSWTAKTASSSIARGQYMTSDGTLLYVFGGDYSQGQVLRRFDPATNIWTTRASLPVYTYGHCGSYITYNGIGYIYVFGNEANGTNTILKYNSATNSWTTLPITLPGAQRWYGNCATLGSYIYHAGGGTPPVNNFDRLDPATDTLTAMANLPDARRLTGLVAVPLQNKVYMVGGQNSTYTNTATCYAFDPTAGATGTWSTMANRIVSGGTYSDAYMAGWSLKNRVFIHSGSSYPTTLHIFDPSAGATGTWSAAASSLASHYWNGGAATSTKGWAYGGYNNPSYFEEYTAPVFGTPPTCNPSTVQQVGPIAVIPQGGWTGTTVTFRATIADSDVPAQRVALEVEVRPSAGAYTGVPSVSSGLQLQGVVNAVYTVPAGGNYDWRWRVVDQDGNYVPSVAGNPTWNEFNAASPDFQADVVPPTTPLAILPDTTPVTFSTPPGGNVPFDWGVSTDNGPVVTYEIEVAYNDPTFATLTQSATGLTLTDTTFYLTIQPNSYYWRVRARDIGGNPSAWSNVLAFKVLEDEHYDNGSGDGLFGDRMTCSAGTAPSGLALALAALAASAALLRRIR